jgi:hypothetical protein
MIMISVAKDFSRFPAGRFLSDGPYSGEKFREEFLVEPIKKGEEVVVDLDGVAGYGSSFLEEAFGGVVRKLKLARAKVDRIIKINSDDESLVAEVTGYMHEAAV